MLKICLVFWKSEPQYAYKRYAYKKHVEHYAPLNLNQNLVFKPTRLLALNRPYCLLRRHCSTSYQISKMTDVFTRKCIFLKRSHSGRAENIIL